MKGEHAMIRVVCFGIGYLFGLFQTSYIIGKIKGIDIRERGDNEHDPHPWSQMGPYYICR